MHLLKIALGLLVLREKIDGTIAGVIVAPSTRSLGSPESDSENLDRSHVLPMLSRADGAPVSANPKPAIAPIIDQPATHELAGTGVDSTGTIPKSPNEAGYTNPDEMDLAKSIDNSAAFPKLALDAFAVSGDRDSDVVSSCKHAKRYGRKNYIPGRSINKRISGKGIPLPQAESWLNRVEFRLILMKREDPSLNIIMDGLVFGSFSGTVLRGDTDFLIQEVGILWQAGTTDRQIRAVEKAFQQVAEDNRALGDKRKFKLYSTKLEDIQDEEERRNIIKYSTRVAHRGPYDKLVLKHMWFGRQLTSAAEVIRREGDGGAVKLAAEFLWRESSETDNSYSLGRVRDLYNECGYADDVADELIADSAEAIDRQMRRDHPENIGRGFRAEVINFARQHRSQSRPC